jgi:katanin p80 WD40 repeat-containing subunit B1
MSDPGQSSRRVYSLRRFGAHGRTVSALQIGKRSGRVLVTGGDDRLVNMWAIGKPSAIMSLSGLQSAVSAVSFDADEAQVAAGSAGSEGAIKVWDLDKQETFRDFEGAHAGAVSALEYHPFGGHVASGGGEDAALKLWDVRNRSCIQTYRGHAAGVKVVRFSPDGRWAVSGGADHVLKLWDLTAGKELHSFSGGDSTTTGSAPGSGAGSGSFGDTAHGAAVTDIQFHPTEFLLASSDAAGVTKFWDLESFGLVSSVGWNGSQKNSDRGGSGSGGDGGVKKIQFDPNGTGLLAADADSLRVWQWEPENRCLDVVPVKWGHVMDTNITADQYVACAVEESFVTIWVMSLSKLRPWAHPEDEVFDPLEHSSIDLEEQSRIAARLRRSSEEFERRQSGSGGGGGGGGGGGKDSSDAQGHGEKGTAASSSSAGSSGSSGASRDPRPPPAKRTPVDGASSSGETATAAAVAGTNSSGNKAVQGVVMDEEDRSSTPNPADILSDSVGRVDVASGATSIDVADALLKEHSVMVGVLNSRLTKLRLVRRAWTEGDVRECVEMLVQEVNDPAVAVDVVTVLQKKSSLLTLDVCVLLLPVLRDLLESDVSSYVMVALRMAVTLAKSFAPVITDTIATAKKNTQARGNVDLTFEERLEKAQFCFKEFHEISAGLDRVAAKHRKEPVVAKHLRDLRTSLHWLEAST